MAKLKPDLSFERGGRPLAHWLADLVADDPQSREAAELALTAMSFALNSVEGEAADIEGTGWGAVSRFPEWQRRVREAIAEPSFAKQPFFVGLAAHFITKAQQWRERAELLKKADERVDRVCERITQRIKSASNEQEAEKQRQRLLRAACASITPMELPSRRGLAAMSVDTPLHVANAAGALWLEAPEAIWMLLETEGAGYHAMNALEAAGPAAAPIFLDALLANYPTGEPFSTSTGALVSVGRGDVRVIERLLELTEQSDRHGWDAAGGLSEMGEAARAHPQALERLLRLSEDSNRSTLAALALGGVGRGIPKAVQRLLELTHDEHARGEAMLALGRIQGPPAQIVPRLIELMDEFEEYDSDYAHEGRQERVSMALAPYGADAAPAVPKLIEELAQYNPNKEDYPKQIIRTLGMIGSAAAAALPALWQLAGDDAAYLQELRQHVASTPLMDIEHYDILAWSIARIQGRTA